MAIVLTLREITRVNVMHTGRVKTVLRTSTNVKPIIHAIMVERVLIMSVASRVPVPKGWAGNTCESDVDECELFNRCNGSDLCVNIRGSFLCSGSSESTTSNYSSSTSAMAYSYKSYVDAISLQCSEDAWKVHIHVPELYKRHVDFDPSDIYLGEPGCEGYRSGDFLVIYQQYSNCLTHHSMTSGSDVYTNTLVYALRDANYKFIIREFRFRIDLECNMAKQVTVSQHFIETNNQVRRRSNNPRISGHGYYNVLMAFYRDPNFLHQMTGHSVMDTSPLPVDIGTDIYVKLATHVTNTDVKMRLDVCYTLPSPGAGDSLKFYLIRNACVTDVNTRVLSILPHETKFVFRDFEYSTDLHNLYLYCTVTFCNRTDNSSLCDQQCHQRSPRSVIYPANGRYLHRISTSRVIPRPNVKGQRTSIPDEPGQSESHKHTDGIIFISSVLLVAVSVTSAILMMIQLRQKHERHDDDTNDI
ncbi:CUB and zona pellucida-like domain-containing protein 1 [Argopecten irradians]|uniref:CUB and zona pellucida-like domain-containing protein 1 n=1 Tax=Argopecten irradians TaxID=31199 RepID=UPI00371C5BC5